MTTFLVSTRSQRTGRPSKLDDPSVRQQAIVLAATGSSRNAVAATLGFGKPYLQQWLERGAAQPDGEHGEFSRDYLAAERLSEVTGNKILTQRLQAIAKKPEGARTDADLDFVMKRIRSLYPVQHGAGEGLGQFRVIDADVDPQKWWIENGLQLEQLRALLRDPPEQVKEALQLEADAVYAQLRATGWRPKEVT